MSYRVIFHAKAHDEALEAAAYIAEHTSPAASLDWYEGLASAIATLMEYPHRCPLARENEAFPGTEIRQLIFKSHRLIYSVRDREVHVLHVRHFAQANLDDL